MVIGAARRALDELIKLATTTRGTFRSSKLDERQVVHRFIGQADLKLRAVRALLHQRYEELYEIAGAGKIPDAAAIADVRAAALYATDIAIETVTRRLSFRRQFRSASSARHRPLMRDVNTAGLHQVMSDTAYENHGKFRLGLPADPMA